MKDVNAHRLFILDDFGFRGCYLLGENRHFSVEKAVISLINTILKEYNIKKEDVILHGSSKGGWIALYYGIKYGFGYVIAGGPQTKIGNFLIEHEFDTSIVKVADHIAGGHEEEDKEYLNNLLYNLVNPTIKNYPKIYMHIGRGDFHYPKHIKPFLKELDSYNVKYELDVEEYDAHSALEWYYPEFLLETLNSIDNSLLDQVIRRRGDKINLNQYKKSDNIQLRIDRVIEHPSMISLKGWSFIDDEDCEDYDRYLIIMGSKFSHVVLRRKVEEYKLFKETRADVARELNNTKYKYSGFTCRFERGTLKNKFSIGIIFKSKKNKDEIYYQLENKSFRLKNNRKINIQHLLNIFWVKRNIIKK